MPQTRKRKEPGDAGRGEAKRHRTALNKIADEYICPITKELPLDPVMAEDEHIYERSAIEEHVERQGDALRSPMTNEPMGPRLLRTTQARNMIEQLVKSGALDGENARRWKQRVEDQKYVSLLTEDAEKGDSHDMFKLGNIYRSGNRGQKKDKAKAFRWVMRAANLEYPPAMAAAGEALRLGRGTEKHKTEGMVLITMAAERGSSLAAYFLGFCYAKGRGGLRKDTVRARKLLQNVISDNCEITSGVGEAIKFETRNLLNTLSDVNDDSL